MEGSENKPQSTTESENFSDIEDVKVCDICGDAGQEELLAICSRCSDGAEHTYCMQKKLNKLPEGDWLCEECKSKEDSENQNPDEPKTVSGTSKVLFTNEKNQNTGSNIDSKLLPNLDAKAPDSVTSGTCERLQGPQIPAKKQEDNLVVDSATSKDISESSGPPTVTAGSKKKSVMSCKSSCSDLDARKLKQSKPAAYLGGQSVNNSQSCVQSHISLGPNSSTTAGELQPPQEPLSRSDSFSNSHVKPKVEQLIVNPPHEQKVSKEFAFNDIRKEGLVKEMAESASFNDMSSGSYNVGSNCKTQSFNPHQRENQRGLKRAKEKNMVEKKIPVVLEDTNVNPPTAGIGNHSRKLYLEAEHMSESNILDINRDSDDANNSGCDKVKKSYMPKRFGRSSSNVTGQKPCQAVSKKDVCARSNAFGRSYTFPDSLQRSAPQVVESRSWDDKIKHPTFSNGSKQAVSGGSGILRCKKCNETGHPTQLCSIDKLCLYALKPSVDRNQREGSYRSNKWKDAVDATMLKTRVQKSNRAPDHSELPTYRSDLSCKAACGDSQSGFSSCLQNPPHLKGSTGEHDTLRCFVADPTKAATEIDVNLKVIRQADPSCASGASDLNLTETKLDESSVKPFQQDLPNKASILANILSASVIPELESIWQGDFEVQGSGRLPNLCDGVQAHLSCFASPKVVEAAVKFPCKVQVEEVTRQSIWPLQFQGNSPEEHNIALFFFAKDIESYEKGYWKLLEDMIKNDLALKGNIDGIELLIFPSNKLPENSQRWNSLFYLWGIFRGGSKNCLGCLPQFQVKSGGPSLSFEPSVQNLATPVSEFSVSQKVETHDNSDEKIILSDGSFKVKAVKSPSSVEFQPGSSSVVEETIYRTQECSPGGCLSENMSQISSLLIPGPESNNRMNSTELCPGGKITCLNPGDASKSRDDFEPASHADVDREQIRLGEHIPLPRCSGSGESRNEEKTEEKESLMESEVILVNDSRENLTELVPNRKRTLEASAETSSHGEDQTLKRFDGSMQLNETVSSSHGEDRREHKRLKKGISVVSKLDEN